jgi:hypothetical protein
MSTVLEIESAIEKLSPQETRQLAEWLSARTAKPAADSRLEKFRQARGIWKDRNDLPDLQTLRREFDRSHQS